jgi:integrase
MSESHSTAPERPGNAATTASTTAAASPSKPSKPSKPYPEFPLTAHPAGYWCKKIRGTIHYFGPWSDPDGALKKYDEQKEALHAGKKPREESEGITVNKLCNKFLNAKRRLVDSGELSARSWDDYKAACTLVSNHFGKGRLLADVDPDDFAKLRNKMARKWGAVRLGNVIQRVRSIFKYGFEAGLIDRPVRFGPEFKKPSKKTLRLNRARQGPRLFTADEVRRLIDDAGVQMRAMILLGINCGFGNADCGHLPLSAVDLKAGKIDFPRPKTGIPRRCPLWPETIEALKEVLAQRKEPKDEADAGLVFVTKYGLSWYKDTRDNPVSKEMAKLLKTLQINGRKGLGFYTLRHTFRTVADEAKDQPAADHIMGHEAQHMSSHYRETISDARLKAVTGHVRAWLFPPGAGAGPAAGGH